jgi:hypothetical protein
VCVREREREREYARVCVCIADAEPLDRIHFVKVQGIHGVTAGVATRALNSLRSQALTLIRANNWALSSAGVAQEAELAFAMGTHHR